MALTQAQIRGAGLLGIQGDSGKGKTRLGYDLAPLLGARDFETSNGFRGFTVLVQRLGVHYLDVKACSQLAIDKFSYEMRGERVIVGGQDVTDDLRSPQTNAQVSTIAGYKRVRMEYVKAMLDWVTVRPAIVIGRHLREVWPEAQLVLQIERSDGLTEEARARDEGEAAAAALATRSEQDRKNVLVALPDVMDEYIVLNTNGMNELEQRDAALALALSAGFQTA